MWNLLWKSPPNYITIGNPPPAFGPSKTCAFADPENKPGYGCTEKESYRLGNRRQGRPPTRHATKPIQTRSSTTQRNFPLSIVSAEFGHLEHEENCFLSHLTDAVRLNRLKNEVAQAIAECDEAVVVEGKGAAELTAKTNIIRQRSVASLLDFVSNGDVNAQNIREKQARLLEQRDELDRRLHTIKAHLNKALSDVYQTSESFVIDPPQDDRNGKHKIMNMSNGFAIMTYVYQACDQQLKMERTALVVIRERYMESVSNLRACKARESRRVKDARSKQEEERKKGQEQVQRLRKEFTLAQKILAASEKAQDLRVDAYMERAALHLGDRIHTRTELTTRNLRKIPKFNGFTDNQRNALRGMVLQPNRDDEGRPGPMHSTELFVAPEVPNFWEQRKIFEDAQSRLRTLQMKHNNPMVAHLTAFPGSDEENWHRLRREGNFFDFPAAEKLALDEVETARQSYEEARKAMRQHLDAQPTPSEPCFEEGSFAAQTTDYNGSEGPIFFREAEKNPTPEAMRIWNALVSKEADTGLAGDVQHSQHSSSAAVEVVRDGEVVSNGESLALEKDKSRKQDLLKYWNAKMENVRVQAEQQKEVVMG